GEQLAHSRIIVFGDRQLARNEPARSGPDQRAAAASAEARVNQQHQISWANTAVCLGPVEVNEAIVRAEVTRFSYVVGQDELSLAPKQARHRIPDAEIWRMRDNCCEVFKAVTCLFKALFDRTAD